ncbi:cellobiose phosphorylase [Marinobacter halodurans]|uniref:Cellobiose phosphorylase n=1 Tax=Marinobacter halodurans TaxID=2528979 RepID=A0ABY1ZGW6_9GAMM|nr:glucoamylase family protein [Marinobacter halodurans]TBW51545.1 cellobiose phosphorylase [Marinobacter halodurans]
MAVNMEKGPGTGRVDAGANAGDDGQNPWATTGPGSRRTHRPLNETLKRHAHRLDRIHKALYALRSNPSVAGPWIDWYIDNEYLIRRVLHMLRRDLSVDFVAYLPVLTEPPSTGRIRVLEMARVALERAEQRFDHNVLEAMVLELKETTPLNTAELWALPLLLRYHALVQVLDAVQRRIAELASHDAHRGMVDVESRDLVTDGVVTLHRLERTNWQGFFERTSQVEALLRKDPAGAYPRMDFSTRDRYRGRVEQLSRRSDMDELAVAQRVLELARQAREEAQDATSVAAHIGYYLIGDGHRLLEQTLNVHLDRSTRFRRWLVHHRQQLYFIALSLTALLLVTIPTAYAWLQGGPWQALAVVLVVGVPALVLASILVNWLATLTVPTRVLPKLDFIDGIHVDHKAAVCMALLVSSEKDIQSAIDTLERHYLANPDKQLRFGLLTGLFDAQEATTPRDGSLLERLREGMTSLNRQYASEGHAPFFWMHRSRSFNRQDAIWMEWERKRGKLTEFNRYVLTGNRGSFSDTAGDIDWLRQARYVITLDADTLLPVDGARRLIGTIAHPLNQPVWDEETGEVLSGYSILQPRIEINPMTAIRNIFTRIFSGDRGLDLYTLAVSDAYQDVFGEGIFTGKGLYHVAAFEASLRNAVPEGTVLSHDLFEGIHGRTALVSDVVMYEEYPPDYLCFGRRLHRWIRGDWQLLPWLWPSVPTESGERRPNKLTGLHRWQLVHNLLRSLQAPWLLLLLLLGWFALPGSPLHWTALAVLTLLVPSLTGFVGLAHATVRRRRAAQQVRNLKGDLKRWVLVIAFLPQEAYLTLDAVIRSIYRSQISHRRMLEWAPAALEAGRSDNATPWRYWRAMWVGPVGATIVTCLLLVSTPVTLIYAAPVLLLWLVSPQLAFLARRDRKLPIERIRAEDRTHLRRLARRTWYFFERFVGPEDHWLPPDHFQEDPKGVVAHRTSPTNIGLLLVSNLTAYDMGYVDAQELVIRSRNTLRSMARLPRFRGHIHNWCDTHQLTTLPPAYVSTVDSGNLLGSLLALKQGLLGLEADAVWRFGQFEGLLDTMGVLEDSLGDYPKTTPRRRLGQQLMAIRRQVMDARSSPRQWPGLLDEIANRLKRELDQAVQEVIREPSPLPADVLADMRIWLERSRHHIERMYQGRDQFLSWWSMFDTWPTIHPGDLPPRQYEAWLALEKELVHVPTYLELTTLESRLAPLIEQLMATGDGGAVPDRLQQWLASLSMAVGKASRAATLLLTTAKQLADTCESWFEETDLAFLYDREAEVFRIGYNVDEGRLDDNAYDLLASEARLASFLGIAKGDISARHWVHLGRPMTRDHGHPLLLSWSGTMFEYLMPQLLMREPATTLLGMSARAAIDHQIQYAANRGLPWGISESGYYLLDGAQNYAYHAFGAPHLSLRSHKGAKDWVIAPYATFLALLWRPQAAFDNLRHLERLGMLGRYGFFEALDYTERRMEVGQTYSIVRSYMAHHHGMSLISLGISLSPENAVSRFSEDPRVEASELLLQERVALDVDVEYPAHGGEEERESDASETPHIAPWQISPDSPMPRVHLLSNGRLGVLVSSWGAGATRWKSDAITRWRPDGTLESWGNWLYVQDLGRRDIWSIPRAPLKGRGIREHVRFHSHCAEFQRHDTSLIQTLEITVSPWHDVELRRVTITNHGDMPRRLRFTSYAEMVLADPRGDSQHPAFGNLFVHSEFVESRGLLVFERRPRDPEDQPPVVGELMMGLSGVLTPDAIETDRSAFLGRGGSIAHPKALETGQALTGSLGYTLDPVAVLQKTLKINPTASVQFAFLRIVGESREEVLATAARFAFWPRVQRTFEEGQAQASRELWRSKLSSDEFRTMTSLASALLYSPPQLRAPVPILSANRMQQANLWGVGISGDFPIVLVRIGREADIETAHLLLKIHAHWRKRNFSVDLILLNTGDTGYEGTTQDTVRRLLAQHNAEPFVGRRGGIFPLTSESLSKEEVVLLQTAAKVVLDASAASLSEALSKLERAESPLPRLRVRPHDATPPATPAALPPHDALSCDNGHGGFTADGREYVITVSHRQPTPAPWINVLANPDFGTVLSESGGGFSWYQNSGENRLTPWRNDPTLDEPGECLYLRDEETGALWAATPNPVAHESTYRIRHGAGYTVFEHSRHDIESRMTVFVPPSDAIKVVQLRLRNHSDRVRRLTLTYYAEWVLGTRREDTSPYIQPAFLAEQGALIAANPYNPDWPKQIAFLATDSHVHGYTTDRLEFLGRQGGLENPAALKRVGLTNRVEPGRDPCAALQVHVDLPTADQGEQTVTFFVGAQATFDEAVALIDRYRQPDAVAQAREATRDYWDAVLGALTLSCPDDSVAFIFNRWLLYQTLGCRIQGRSALYQSSGAYGFRDQLQDSLAMLHTRPDVCRAQILAAAARQFPEGDVLHWWHPPNARGVRTRISDDLVWLPLVVSEYLEVTGDIGVLDEPVPWLIGEPLEDNQAEHYGQFGTSTDTSPVYDHCLRVLERADRLGTHGLPLIGGGDWNDGMNRVGWEGRGESVWMGWFLIQTLRRFANVCIGRGDDATAETFRKRALDLSDALQHHAWDGNWYRRAYYDDQTPLGSAGQNACEIDSIPQSWAVLSGAAEPERTHKAMEAVWERLVRPDPGQVLLFTPPFTGRGQGQPDPGYIAAYPPGVRENGGQYTHAACWAGLAFAALGDAERASVVLDCLNPVKHGDSPGRIAQYQVEPYVLAADIYGEPPHVGRGGWTWYTGSAGWLYRFILEGILGIRKRGNHLEVSPCLPPHWPGYTLRYVFGRSVYHITVQRLSADSTALDGPCCFALQDDGDEHTVVIGV